jgi:murein DD-endopeptidase MepM/ murein hydrolase activator NlpD
MQNSRGFFPVRATVAVTALTALTACNEPFDYDLRGNLGGFSTKTAALAVETADRPKPDARGIISYPSYQVVVAQRGDSVTDVANRIDLPAGELARFNGMQPDDKLREGEVLALPRRVSEPAAGTPGSIDIATLAGSAIDAAPETPAVETTALEPAPAAPKPKPVEPTRHKVKRGETAYTISRLYNVPIESLAEWNGLGPDFAIREGQYLLIPVKNQAAPKTASKTAAKATTVTQPGAGSPTPTPPSATKPLPDEKVSAKAPEAPKVDVGQPTKPSTSALAIPVQGKIIRGYSKGRNDGIDIAGTPGGAVKAAEAGTVAAITKDADQVPIIVLKHSSGLLTVYANVGNIAVSKGASVKRGQKIASLRSGDDAYVHFEVRDGFDSVDPEPYLKP